jgi:uncharacterized protein
MWLIRYYENIFGELLKKGKVLVIYGPRQVGKTSLIRRMLKDGPGIFIGDGIDMEIQALLGSQNLSALRNAFRGYEIIFIDEAHKIPNIGNALKLLVDHEPGIKIIASGSSSFDLSNKLGEPLTGRQNVYRLYPLSAMELATQFGRMHVIQNLDNLLVFGSYPEVITAPNNLEKTTHLINLRNSYLLKDILELENIKNSSKLFDLLRLLAFQIGKSVSLNELSNQLGISKQTVDRYLDLLEKSFIIKKVQGFSKNLRKEITKTHRYYFWDNGVRNSIINNFNKPDHRDDAGGLWENYLFMERIKTQEYGRIYANTFFWRTYDQKEIDMVEERDGKLYGYEFKWGTKTIKPPKLWQETYENAEYKVINKDNFLDFLCEKSQSLM